MLGFAAGTARVRYPRDSGAFGDGAKEIVVTDAPSMSEFCYTLIHGRPESSSEVHMEPLIKGG